LTFGSESKSFLEAVGAGVFAELIVELHKPAKRNEMQGAESRNQTLGFAMERLGVERSFTAPLPPGQSKKKTVNLKPDLPELIAGTFLTGPAKELPRLYDRRKSLSRTVVSLKARVNAEAA
jgi:hypothetical protein